MSTSSSSSASLTSLSESSFNAPELNIYWEQQAAALCGVHALNNLLQGSFFQAMDLANIAQQLKDEETRLMSQSGQESHDFLSYLAHDSSFVDESGNFSVDVLQHALQNFGMNMVLLSAKEPLAEPQKEDGFIANFKDHWLALRKIEGRWFNLNSLLAKPEVISDTHLGMYIMQLQTEGYSVHAIRGSYPNSAMLQEDGKHLIPLSTILAKQPAGKAKTKSASPPISAAASSFDSMDEDADLKQAMQLSLNDNKMQMSTVRPNANAAKSSSTSASPAITPALATASSITDVDMLGEDEEELRKAIELSRQVSGDKANDESRKNGAQSRSQSHISAPNQEIDEDEELRAAIALSLASNSSPAPSSAQVLTPAASASSTLSASESKTHLPFACCCSKCSALPLPPSPTPIAAAALDEPAVDSPDVVNVQLTLPNGNKHRRRFLSSLPVRVVLQLAQFEDKTFARNYPKVKIISNFPRTEYCLNDSFAATKLGKNQNLLITPL